LSYQISVEAPDRDLLTTVEATALTSSVMMKSASPAAINALIPNELDSLNFRAMRAAMLFEP
jgi:hypothetical protein